MKLVSSLIVILLVTTACSGSGDSTSLETTPISTPVPFESSEKISESDQDNKSNQTSSQVESVTETYYIDMEEKIPGGHSGVYLPRHCPEAKSDSINPSYI